jgi:DNA polymerase-3 subunit alpha
MVDTNKVVEYMEECKRLDIAVRPPDVNSSFADFTIVRKDGREDRGFLRFGLAAIKGVGHRAVQAIVAAREEGGPFADIFDFCERVDLSAVNRGVVEALVKAGAFDTTGAMRKALVEVLDDALQAAANNQRDRDAGQMNMFGAFEQDADSAVTHALPNVEWSEAEMLANEKAVLGFYVTRHPLASHAETMQRFATADCAEIVDYAEGAEVILGGMISRLRTLTTKSGRKAGSKMAVLMFEDLTGSIEAVVFSELLETNAELIAPDRLVFLRGEVDRKREEPCVRVSEVIPLEAAPGALAETVVITLSTLGLESDRLERLRAICSEWRGAVPLFLRLETPARMTTFVRCGDELSVRPDDGFLAAIETLLGSGCVDVTGRRTMRRMSAATVERGAEADESGAIEHDAATVSA